MKNLIVAYAKNRVIGKDNDMPWRGELPADLKRFKEVTLEGAVIMGRMTFEAIGRPLPNRENIVLSRNNLEIEGCSVVKSLDEAYEIIGDGKETFIIGGQKIYELAIDQVDRLLVTEIDASFDGDAFFVDIDLEKWKLVSKEVHEPDEANKYKYSFVVYNAIS